MKYVVFVITIGAICIPLALMGLMTGTIIPLLIASTILIVCNVLIEISNKSRFLQDQILELKEQVADQDRKIEMLQAQQSQNVEG